MDDFLTLTLTDGRATVTFTGDGTLRYGFFIQRDAIKGLWDAPALKTALTERQTGNGAHEPQDILYSARTVTIPVYLVPKPGDDTVEGMRLPIDRLLGRRVRLIVDDQVERTYLDGHIHVAYSGLRTTTYDTATITMVCADPRRMATDGRELVLWPTRGFHGGLRYLTGLKYPYDYGVAATDLRNMGSLSNKGDSVAYPTIHVYQMDEGVRLRWSQDGQPHLLEWAGWVGNEPLIIDCHDRTARVGTADESYQFVSRDFPAIRPGGSVGFELQSAGTGYVIINTRDTYI